MVCFFIFKIKEDKVEELANEYLKAIDKVKEHIKKLEKERKETKSLETKRKLTEKIYHHSYVLRDLQVTHATVKTYYDKSLKVSKWL